MAESGLQVSIVGLGCNNFGSRVNTAGARAAIEKCLEAGITFFDTADLYGDGKSEQHPANVAEAERSRPVGTDAPPGCRGSSRKLLASSQ